MFSVIKGIWTILKHSFRKRETILYPEEHPRISPRWRGRIILSRDPDGGERCVACYLSAVACPVDCISLQAAQDEHGRRYPSFLPNQFLAVHFLRFLRRGVPHVRHSAHNGF